MSGDIPFYRTRMGQVFYEGTMPRLVAALEKLAKQELVLKAINSIQMDPEGVLVLEKLLSA